MLCNPQSKYYWYDFSGSGRRMKLNNFAYTEDDGWVTSRPAHLVTDGVDSYGKNTETEINPVNTSFSLVCAFKMPNTSGDKHIMVCSQSDSIYGIFLYINSNAPKLFLQNSSDSTYLLTPDSTTISADEWHIATGVYDPTTKKCKL